MDALEEWRPQIFYSDGALKGQPVSCHVHAVN